MLHLVIKGNEFDAYRAASARGVRLLRSREAHGEVLAYTDAPEGMVAAWFAEPGAVPYPAGALLFYAPAWRPFPGGPPAAEGGAR